MKTEPEMFLLTNGTSGAIHLDLYAKSKVDSSIQEERLFSHLPRIFRQTVYLDNISEIGSIEITFGSPNIVKDKSPILLECLILFESGECYPFCPPFKPVVTKLDESYGLYPC